MSQSGMRLTISTVCLDHMMSTPKDVFNIISSFLRSALSLPQALRAAETQQTANPSPGLAKGRVCSLGGHLISPLHCRLPSPPACLWSEAKPLHTQGLGQLVAGFFLQVCSQPRWATAEVLQPSHAPMASAWGTERRSWSPAGHLFIPLGEKNS